MRTAAINFVQWVLEKHLLVASTVLIDCPEDQQPIMDAWMSGHSVRYAHTHDFKLLLGEAFGYVILMGALQRDENFFNTVQQVRRVLKPGGLLIVTTAGMNFPKDSRAKWRFTAQSLETLLTGFDGVYTEAYDDGQTICAFAWKQLKQAANPTEAAQKEGAIQC